MKLVPTSEFEMVAKALYGEGAWTIMKAAPEKPKKGGLSNADKGLVASNVASAAIGVGTLNQLRKPVQGTLKGTVPNREAGGIPRASVRGGVKMGVPGARKTLRALNKFGRSRAGKITVAGGLIGGAAFNTAADAASAVSIAQKGKKKDVSKADTKVKPGTILRANEAPHVQPGTKMKLVALDKVETTARTQGKKIVVRAKKSGQAAAQTWKAEAKVSKALEDKRQVFGWASITEMDGKPVVDLQSDYVTIEEIEKAAYTYVSKSRKGGDMHLRDGEGPKHVADMIESVVITPEKKEALGLPPESPTGWFVGFQVHDDETWRLVKDGKRPMFSIHGSGRRQDREIDA